MNGHFDIVRLLIDANADIDLPDKVYRRSLCMTIYFADKIAMPLCMTRYFADKLAMPLCMTRYFADKIAMPLCMTKYFADKIAMHDTIHCLSV